MHQTLSISIVQLCALVTRQFFFANRRHVPPATPHRTPTEQQWGRNRGIRANGSPPSSGGGTAGGSERTRARHVWIRAVGARQRDLGVGGTYRLSAYPRCYFCQFAHRGLFLLFRRKQCHFRQ